LARTTGSDGEKTEAAIRAAAEMLIARHGYEAVSMRQLATEVGVQAAALYRYFPTKEDLLFTLMHAHMQELAAAWERARPAAADPARRLAAFVANHIRFHVMRRHSTHVSNMELRSLSRERLSAMLKLRASPFTTGVCGKRRDLTRVPSTNTCCGAGRICASDSFIARCVACRILIESTTSASTCAMAKQTAG
jgi:AcrR family transcriptional regulator